MRRLYADREEKRVTRGSDISGQDGEQEQLDDPNQGSLLERSRLRGLAEGMKISYDVEADRKSGKESATNLKVA
jgi:hypothetical protein